MREKSLSILHSPSVQIPPFSVYTYFKTSGYLKPWYASLHPSNFNGALEFHPLFVTSFQARAGTNVPVGLAGRPSGHWPTLRDELTWLIRNQFCQFSYKD